MLGWGWPPGMFMGAEAALHRHEMGGFPGRSSVGAGCLLCWVSELVLGRALWLV